MRAICQQCTAQGSPDCRTCTWPENVRYPVLYDGPKILDMRGMDRVTSMGVR